MLPTELLKQIHRRAPDGRRLAERFARLGFTQGITTGIAKPANIREQFPISGEFRLDGHVDPDRLSGPP